MLPLHYMHARTQTQCTVETIYIVFMLGRFWTSSPSTSLKHENEIDGLGLNDGTADTNNCCQLPWQVSADNGLVQPNGTVAMSFSSNFPTNIFTLLVVRLFACVGVWAPTISGMSVILKKGTCLRDKLLHLLKNKIPVNSRELS